MRVVATEPFTTYYQGVCASIQAGQVLEGEIAAYLLEGGSAVEPVSGGTLPPPRDDDDSVPVNISPGGYMPASDSGPVDETEADQQPAAGDLDITGSIQQVLAWVDGDPDRATEAADAEAAKDKPRSTLLAKLSEITDP